ncbi:MAG: hypothetical protein V3S14_07600 [Anaerolineae bacterium]
MKNKTQLVSIMVFVLGVVLFLGVLALWVGAYSPQRSSAPATASPTAPQTTTRAPTPTHVPPTATPTPVASATPGPSPTPRLPPVLLTYMALDPTLTVEAFDARATAMAELGTILPPSPTPEVPPPTPTMTAKEQALVEERQRAHRQAAASVEECGEILQTEPWCTVSWYATRITRPEWETLFPYTEFFLVKADRYGGEFGPETHNRLIIEAWWDKRLSREDFHTLMGGEHVSVTDENRELVAKAFVLVFLADYLEEEIVFSDGEEGSWPSDIRKPFDYRITAWTRIQGLKFEWLLMFHEGEIFGAEGLVIERNVGDYIDVPFERLPVPSMQQLSYWRNQQW